MTLPAGHIAIPRTDWQRLQDDLAALRRQVERNASTARFAVQKATRLEKQSNHKLMRVSALAKHLGLPKSTLRDRIADLVDARLLTRFQVDGETPWRGGTRSPQYIWLDQYLDAVKADVEANQPTPPKKRGAR